MARHPRLIYPDVALHVVQRGNNRQDCFLHDNDRLVYLAILRDLAQPSAVPYPRVLPRDQPCTHPHHAAERGGLQSDDARLAALLRSVFQSPILEDGQPVGAAVSFLPRGVERIRPQLLPLYRADPGSSRDGPVTWSVSVVELRRQRS